MARWLSSLFLCVFLTKVVAQRLPVRIDTLYVQDYGGAPMVYWQAGDEFDAAFFVVERSTDLRRWLPLQSVSVTTLMERRDKTAPYRHWDRAAPALRPLWYRLRVVREIGIYSYTHPACIYGANAPAVWADGQLSTASEITIHSRADSLRCALKISALSADSQAIIQDSIQLKKGINRLPVQLPTGLFLLQIDGWRFLLFGG